MTLMHPPRMAGRAMSPRAVRPGRVLTLAESLVLVVVFGALVGFAVGTGLADLLVVVLRHVDQSVVGSRG